MLAALRSPCSRLALALGSGSLRSLAPLFIVWRSYIIQVRRTSLFSDHRPLDTDHSLLIANCKLLIIKHAKPMPEKSRFVYRLRHFMLSVFIGRKMRYPQFIFIEQLNIHIPPFKYAYLFIEYRRRR